MLPVMLVAACTEDPPTGPSVASSVALVSGSNQTGTPGYRLASEVVVRVTDANGAGIEGETVTFASEDPFAFPEPASVVTDEDGNARTWWRLGGVPGAQHLSARVGALPAAQVTATAASLPIRAMTGGRTHYCIVDGDGVLSCGAHPDLGQANPAPRVVAPGTTRFTEVVSNSSAVRGCAVAESGRLWCFTLAADRSFASLEEVPGGYPALHGITAGYYSSQPAYCGLSATGQGWCWGRNTSDNRLDAPTPSTSDIQPTAISTNQAFATIRLGADHGCGITPQGVAWCWGDNDFGKAGQPTSMATTRPAPVTAPQPFADLALDDRQATTCGVGVQGGVWCWGKGSVYADPALVSPIGASPVALAGFSGARDLASHGSNLSSLHSGSAGATSRLDFEFLGSITWRSTDFASISFDSFLDGKQFDLACGRLPGNASVICRTLESKMHEINPVITNRIPVLGIPPQ
jgi:hypothetical protein